MCTFKKPTSFGTVLLSTDSLSFYSCCPIAKANIAAIKIFSHCLHTRVHSIAICT